MQLADIESKGLYDEKDSAKNTNDLITKAEEGLVLRNTVEARAIINQFVSALKINTIQYENLQTKLETSNKLIDVFEIRLQDKEAFIEEEKKLRKFYQKTLIKMVRELKLFEDDTDKKQKFELINEDEDDLNYQRQISFLLQNINLQQACIDHTNKYYGQKEGIIKIQQNLNEIGIIDKADNFSNSEDSENDLNERTQNIDLVQTINKKGGKQATQNPLQVPNKKITQKQQSIVRATENYSPQATLKGATQNEALLKYVQDQERKKKKKETLKQLQTVLKDAIEGNLENPVSTEESGGVPTQINQNDLRQKLTALIAEVSPEMLQDFRFNKDQDQIVPTPVKPVKKNVQKKLSEQKTAIKKKESAQISISSKKDEEKKEQKSEIVKKIIRQESVADKQVVQQIKKSDEKKEVVANEVKQQDKVQEIQKKENQQNKDNQKQKKTDQNQKNIKKTEETNLKIQKEEEIKTEIIQNVKEIEKQPIKQVEENQFSRDNDVNEQTIQSNKVLDEISTKNATIKSTQDQENQEKVNTPKMKTPIVEAAIKEQQIQQETAQGICLIQQELNKLYEKKFSKILQNYQAEDQKKMKAVQINQLQDLVERTLGIQLPYGERMELFQAEITNFFQKLNELIIKQFDFAKIHQFIASGGQQEIKKETKQEKAKTENNLKKISFGNFFKPNFSPSGEFMGFELRPELISLMFEFNDQQQNILKRAIKSCLYINRLLIYGQSNDFLLKQFKDGEMVDEVDTNKKQVDAECQVDLIELHAIQQQEEEEKEEELEVPEDGCEQLLRDFGVGMMIRMDPENQNKRNYYDMIFSNLSGHRLLSYYLEDVFLTMDDRSKNRKITLQKMFCNFQDQIFNIVYDIQKEQRKQLITEKMLSLSVGYNKTDEKTFRTTEIQATVQTRSIMSYTGNELLSAFMSKGQLIIKKSKNQLILDKAMEEEFKMTLDMFDEFAQQLSKLEYEAQKKFDLENMNKDLDNDSDQMSINKGYNQSKKKLKTNKFKGNDKNKEKVQSVQKIQNEMTGLIVNVQKSGALTQQVDEINQKEEKKQIGSKFTSNARFMFSNDESLTSLTKDQSNYVSNPQLQNFQGRNLQTSQTQQIQGITTNMKPFVTQPLARLKQMKVGQKLSEETDPSRIAATKKFNAILRQKLSKIMIKNQNKAIEIDRILNSNTELQNGYSSHFNSIDGITNGFNTTSMYESLMAGVDLDIFKKSRRSKRKQILNKPSAIGLGPGEFNRVSTQNADLGLNKSLDQASQVNFENIETEQPEIIIQVTKQKGSRNGKLLQYNKSTVTNSKNIDMIKSQENTDQSSNSMRNTNEITSNYKLQQSSLITPMTAKTQKFQDKLNTAMLYRQSEIQRKVLNYDSAMAEITQVPNYLLSDSFYSKKNRIDNTKTTLDKLVHSKVLENQKQFGGWNLINQQIDKIRQGTSTQLSPINFEGIRSPMTNLRSPVEKSRFDVANSPSSMKNINYDKQGISRQSILEEEAMKAIKHKIDFDDFKKHIVSKSYHKQVFKELNIKGQSKL